MTLEKIQETLEAIDFRFKTFEECLETMLVKDFAAGNKVVRGYIKEALKALQEHIENDGKGKCQADDLIYLREHHHICQTAIGLARYSLQNDQASEAEEYLDRACDQINEIVAINADQFSPTPPRSK